MIRKNLISQRRFFHARSAVKKSGRSRDGKQRDSAQIPAGINGGIVIRINSGVNRSGNLCALSVERSSRPMAAVTGNTAHMIATSVTGSGVSNDGIDEAGVSERMPFFGHDESCPKHAAERPDFPR